MSTTIPQWTAAFDYVSRTIRYLGPRIERYRLWEQTQDIPDMLPNASPVMPIYGIEWDGADRNSGLTGPGDVSNQFVACTFILHPDFSRYLEGLVFANQGSMFSEPSGLVSEAIRYCLRQSVGTPSIPQAIENENLIVALRNLLNPIKGTTTDYRNVVSFDFNETNSQFTVWNPSPDITFMAPNNPDTLLDSTLRIGSLGVPGRQLPYIQFTLEQNFARYLRRVLGSFLSFRDRGLSKSMFLENVIAAYRKKISPDLLGDKRPEMGKLLEALEPKGRDMSSNWVLDTPSPYYRDNAMYLFERANRGLEAQARDLNDLRNQVSQVQAQLKQTLAALAQKTEQPESLLSDPLLGQRESLMRGLKDPAVDFESVVLPDSLKHDIRTALVQQEQRQLLFEEWGLAGAIEKGRGTVLLFHGAPGTGKTLMGEAIAAHLGKKLWVVGSGNLSAGIMGQFEKGINLVFDEASEQGHVVVLDECDSLVASRDGRPGIVRFSSGVEAAWTNHLLRRIEEFEGVLILTTNRLPVLDEALATRIGLTAEFPFPDQTARLAIWQALLGKTKIPTRGLKLDILAELPLVGRDIKNALLMAAGMAASEEKKVLKQTHLLHAADLVLKNAAQHGHEPQRPPVFC